MSNWESATTLLASGTQTSNGAGSAVDLGTRDRLLRQTIAVTAASGSSPLLDVRLEASADGLTGWTPFGSFARATTLGTEKVSFVSPERYVRVAWTVAGTGPSFTFQVVGTRGLCFANLDDFATHGLPAATSAALKPSKIAEALAATTELASGKLATRYTLPILTWGSDITQAICKISAYDILSVRGFNPDGDDQNVRDRYLDAMKWLADVAASKADPIGLTDSSATTVPDDGVVISTTVRRGW